MDTEGDDDRHKQHVEPGYQDHELWAVHALCALRRPADELPRTAQGRSLRSPTAQTFSTTQNGRLWVGRVEIVKRSG